MKRFRTEGNSDNQPTFDDFGGFSSVVRRAHELIKLPLERHAELAKIGARAIKGVLFTGPPGTGKTMLARIIAAQADAAFYEISGPEIFSKWYGQSEELLRRIFDAAAKEKRAIIFFDEIDSVAAQRADDAHEASRRVVAQLLTLMDGFDSTRNIVVIAATNRPQDLDIALRRPGRFDWEIEFPLPGKDDRLDILIKIARKLETQDGRLLRRRSMRKTHSGSISCSPTLRSGVDAGTCTLQRLRPRSCNGRRDSWSGCGRWRGGHSTSTVATTLVSFTRLKEYHSDRTSIR